MLDRFGPHPPPVERLAVAGRAAHRRGQLARSTSIQREDVLRRASATPTDEKIEELAAATAAKCASWTNGAPTCRWTGEIAQSERILEPVKALLRPN